MTATQERLVRLIADGALHSGTDLAVDLGITRAAVWKAVHQLGDIGLEVSTQQGKGYRLPLALELLDVQRITAALAPATRERLQMLEVLWSIPSTSDRLLAAGPAANGQASACLAEFQTGGRGRRGRPWLVPAGQGICLSVAWTFAASPALLHCLGLVAGVGVLRAVRRAGASRAALKWPNDIVIDGHKLAGILIDVQGEAAGPLRVVAGVGLNYELSEAAVAAITAAGGLPPAAFVPQAGPLPPSRNELAAALLDELLATLDEFARCGFDGLADEWRAADYLAGKTVHVSAADGELTGVAQGISSDGRLSLRTGAGVVQLLSGDVSVRPEP